MAIGETILVGFSMGLCLLFAWAIHARGEVGLIAGYQAGDLPADREQALKGDIRNLLVGVAAVLGLTVVEAWTGNIPYVDVFVLVSILLGVGWIVWNYR